MVEASGSESTPGNEKLPEEELSALKTRVSELEQAVAGKENEIAGLKQAGQESEKKLNESLSKAVSSYRALVVRSNPEILDELVSGDTIESIDESLSRAKDLVTRVRLGVQNEILKTKVPAGAPERTPPDLSALSPREKIQYGIGKN